MRSKLLWIKIVIIINEFYKLCSWQIITHNRGSSNFPKCSPQRCVIWSVPILHLDCLQQKHVQNSLLTGKPGLAEPFVVPQNWLHRSKRSKIWLRIHHSFRELAGWQSVQEYRHNASASWPVHRKWQVGVRRVDWLALANGKSETYNRIRCFRYGLALYGRCQKSTGGQWRGAPIRESRWRQSRVG